MAQGRFRGAVVALGIAVLGLFGLAAPASAEAPVGQLTLSITVFDPATGAPAGTRSVTLTCEPTGGDHPDAAAACADLIAAGGDISAIPPVDDSGCQVHSAAELDASGTWNGVPVSYGAKGQSFCELNTHTGGHVFSF